MGRPVLQTLWVNVTLGIGTVLGIKFADFLFWDEDVKYKIWEQTETRFWQEHGVPQNITPFIEFESAIEEGKIFKSYLPEGKPQTLDEVLEKYEI